jgi:hypothetical protein
MRAEERDASQRDTPKNRQSATSKGRGSPNNQQRQMVKGKNTQAKNGDKDNGQGGHRPPRRRRRTVA